MAIKAMRSGLAGLTIALILALYLGSVSRLLRMKDFSTLSTPSLDVVDYVSGDTSVNDYGSDHDATIATTTNFSRRAIPPGHPFEGIFSMENWRSKQLQESQVLSALVEALDLLRAGVQALAAMDPNNPSPSFRRYFPPTAYTRTRYVLNQLAVQLGLPVPQWQYTYVPILQALPLRIFYQFAPGSPDAQECVRTDRLVSAYMSKQTYLNQPLNERRTRHLVICQRTLDFNNEDPDDHFRFRSLTDVQRDGLDPFASVRGVQEFNYNSGGMFFTGMILLHEILHWTEVTRPIAGYEIEDQVYNSPTRGPGLKTARTPWETRELKRVDENLACYNDQSFIWFMVEELFRERCKYSARLEICTEGPQGLPFSGCRASQPESTSSPSSTTSNNDFMMPETSQNTSLQPTSHQWSLSTLFDLGLMDTTSI
ncbi:hypothetical protein PMZ80_007153 [Knufia obscura]|uniref:Uncharacterized protein n=1 Tax=Knufia obscura TaxID=1635080 RepID=A0ABR0RJE3_9EURO|nr:hypothetical protein PMZ80_007153 [Knufia obscura]